MRRFQCIDIICKAWFIPTASNFEWCPESKWNSNTAVIVHWSGLMTMMTNEHFASGCFTQRSHFPHVSTFHLGRPTGTQCHTKERPRWTALYIPSPSHCHHQSEIDKKKHEKTTFASGTPARWKTRAQGSAVWPPHHRRLGLGRALALGPGPSGSCYFEVASKAGAQARMGRATAPEVQPGPEEDAEEEVLIAVSSSMSKLCWGDFLKMHFDWHVLGCFWFFLCILHVVLVCVMIVMLDVETGRRICVYFVLGLRRALQKGFVGSAWKCISFRRNELDRRCRQAKRWWALVSLSWNTHEQTRTNTITQPPCLAQAERSRMNYQSQGRSWRWFQWPMKWRFPALLLGCRIASS